MKHSNKKAKLGAILCAVMLSVCGAFSLAGCGDTGLIFEDYDADVNSQPVIPAEHKDLSLATGTVVAPGEVVMYQQLAPEGAARTYTFNEGLRIMIYGAWSYYGQGDRPYRAVTETSLTLAMGRRYLFALMNNTDHDLTLNVTIEDAKTLTLDSELTQTVGATVQYYRFTAPQKGLYEVSLNGWSSESGAGITFYQPDFQRKFVSTLENATQTKRYKLYLTEGESIYLGASASRQNTDIVIDVTRHTDAGKWTQDGKEVAYSLLRIRRTGAVTTGVIGAQTEDGVANGALTYDNATAAMLIAEGNKLGVKSLTPLSMANYNFLTVRQNGVTGRDLTVQVIPIAAPRLVASFDDVTDGRFDLVDADIKYEDGNTETVTVTVEITLADGTVTTQDIAMNKVESLYNNIVSDKPIPKGATTLRIKSMRYAANGRNILYTADEYPELFTQEPLVLNIV